jgi:hypothetical protein
VAITLTATAKRDPRAPYAFKLGGRVVPKAGAACPAGAKVAVTITLGSRTVGKATISIGRRCTFAATVKVSRRGRLRAVARTIAGPTLAAAVSRPLGLRAG